tara:strand:+ start:654 stop:1649 length:996 start_codon:yes stop_codon:yes gene_type:complete
MAYTTIDNPELYFQTKLYTGTGSSNAITLDGSENMQPDWVWIKCRDDSHNHQVFDSVRGVHKRMRTDTDGAETESSESLKSFDSDGFTVGTQANVNASASGDNSFVSWNWKETATAGFDIVGFTGNATARTISHSLSAVPKFYIVKNRSTTGHWRVYHHKLGATKHINLEDTGAGGTASSVFNDTEPTSSVFSVGTDTSANGNGNSLITYLFSEIKGYSRFGTYEGNGVASGGGPFIYLGFRPAWFLLKEVGTDAWTLMDNKRLGYNPRNDHLFPDNSNVEYATDRIDMVSNGIKINDNDGSINQDGQTYIYMAFAESPIVNSNGIPNNAR